MNWKTAAESDLRLYILRLESQNSINERIAALKEQQNAIKTGNTNKITAQGGQAKAEDRLLNCIVEIERLKYNLSAVSRLIKLTEKGLSMLSDEEKTVLDAFYINASERCVDLLRETLGYEKSQIYRMRERALYKFTISCYGIIDL